MLLKKNLYEEIVVSKKIVGVEMVYRLNEGFIKVMLNFKSLITLE